MDSFSQYELTLIPPGTTLFCGVDEAGRGPLAGPVVAAAVIFPQDIILPGINDSKVLSPEKRLILKGEITLKAIAWGIGTASAWEIDEMNILEASRLAMKRAVKELNPVPGFGLIDGYPVPDWDFPHEGVIKGDSKCFTIAAASILAKVHRDNIMVKMHEQYPDYGFDRHKGYPTEAHRQALKKHGPCKEHRMSFNLLGDS